MLTDLLTSSIRGAPAQTHPGKAQTGPGGGLFAAVLGALTRGMPTVESEPEATDPPPAAEEATEETSEETTGDVAQMPLAPDRPRQALEGEGVLSMPLVGEEAGGMESETFAQIKKARAGEPAKATPGSGEQTATPTVPPNSTTIAGAQTTRGEPSTGEPLQASKSAPEAPLPAPLPKAASRDVAELMPLRQSTAESAAGRAGQASIAASAQVFVDAKGAPGPADNTGRAPEGVPAAATLQPSAQDQAKPAESAKADATAKTPVGARADGLPLTSGRGPADLPLMPPAGLPPVARASSLPQQPVLPPEETPPLASAPPATIQRSVAPGMAGLSDQTLSPPTEWHRGDMTKGEPPRVVPSPAVTGGNTAPPPAGTQSVIPLTPPATAAQLANTLRPENSEGSLFLPSGDSPVVTAATPGASVATSLSENTPAHRQSAELARDISQQISAQVLSAGKGRFELSLAPAELGKVEIWLQENDNRLTLSVSAERPETMDLIRRHIGLLEQELRQMGFGGLSLQLGGNGAPGSHGGRSPRNYPIAEGIAAPAEPLRRAATAVLAGERLDLRL